MFGPSAKKIKIETARVVEGHEEFEVEGAMASTAKSINQGHITYKLITPQNTASASSNASAVPQFYVIGNPNDLTAATGGRVLAPKTALTISNNPTIGSVSESMNTSASRRIDRRRQTHNEVERRRRDTINAWIMQLGKLIPDLDMDEQEKGPPKGGALSKGGILQKACDYVNELTEDNKTLLKRVKELENVESDNERLRSLVSELTEENTVLKQRLENHGITGMDDILGS